MLRQVVAVLIVLLGPMWLGPAMGPLARALGASIEHQCACGMKRGSCGCPTCMAEEQERVYASRHMVVQNGCSTDDVVPTVSVAPQAAAASPVAVIAAASTRAPSPLEIPTVHTRTVDAPPTPPPRRA